LKTFEIRLNDRNYARGDTLTIQEFDPHRGRYTGEVEMRQVTHMVTGKELMGGVVLSSNYVIMSLAHVGAAEQGERGHSRDAGEF
jgi:hypothetical protein